ncbi:carboxypeptidase-like regulatory domain-containing protein [Rhodococcus sp. NPDC060090]|uniref:carboxypeptidase-like regulatory domain-containing protein n=1 Tax=Rhodococcus sp. NPDC060090 TaxID=3347056 RepID=UPI003650EBFF
MVGTVTCDGRPTAGALVALGEAMGKQVDSTHCDDRGCYSFQLPPTGRYVLIAYDTRTGHAHAHKVSLTMESEVVDIDIPVGSTQPAS